MRSKSEANIGGTHQESASETKQCQDDLSVVGRVLNSRFCLWRVPLLMIVLPLLIFNSNSGMSVPSIQADDLKDYYHELTSNANRILSQDENLRNALITITAIIQDLTLLFTVSSWIIKANNWRFPVAFLLFYFVKLLCGLIFSLKEPTNSLWGSAYISLTFTETKNWNFFFSGLLGLNLICFMEIRKGSDSVLAKIIGTCAILNIIYQVILFGFLRSNYIIDMFTSLLVSHYSIYIGDLLNQPINSLIFDLNFTEEVESSKKET